MTWTRWILAATLSLVPPLLLLITYTYWWAGRMEIRYYNERVSGYIPVAGGGGGDLSELTEIGKVIASRYVGDGDTPDVYIWGGKFE